MQKTGTAIILSGPSGAGKSTLVGEVRKVMPELDFSISCTTRAPRGSEKNGVEYYFLPEAEFQERIARNEFLEYAEVHAHHYGTLKSEVLDRVRRGAGVILDIDVQGAMQIRRTAASDPELAKHLAFVFIAPPSVEVLEARLRGRATDSAEQIAIRLAAARRELSFWHNYDYLVINDDLKRAVADMTALFRAFALRTDAVIGEVF